MYFELFTCVIPNVSNDIQTQRSQKFAQGNSVFHMVPYSLFQDRELGKRD